MLHSLPVFTLCRAFVNMPFNNMDITLATVNLLHSVCPEQPALLILLILLGESLQVWGGPRSHAYLAHFLAV